MEILVDAFIEEFYSVPSTCELLLYEAYDLLLVFANFFLAVTKHRRARYSI